MPIAAVDVPVRNTAAAVSPDAATRSFCVVGAWRSTTGSVKNTRAPNAASRTGNDRRRASVYTPVLHASAAKN